MMNIIRADLYAILRGKALYITLGLLLAIHFLIFGLLARVETMTGEIAEPHMFSGVSSVTVLHSQFNILPFFMLSLLLVVAAPIFDNGTIKNDLAWGINRTKLCFSKLTLAICLCIALVMFYFATGMAVATLLNGIGAQRRTATGITPPKPSAYSP